MIDRRAHPPVAAGRRQLLIGAPFLLLAALAMPPVRAQSWPAKPVRIDVPFAAGGATDVIARVLAQRLSDKWGQAVTVDNRAGAGGNVGADAVAKALPDDYTLLMASGSITINPSIYPRMPFDTQRDLVPITNVAAGPMLVVTAESSRWRSIEDLIVDAKANPGRIAFGSAGVGSQTHLAAENLASAAGVELQHVPYKGEANAYTDAIGGQIQLVVGNFAAAAALLGNGRLRALAVTGRERSPLLPEVPTVAERLPGFENTGWFGLLGPAGIPAGVLARVHGDCVAALAEAPVKAQLSTLGMTAVGSNPTEFRRQIDAELKRWAELVQQRRISVN